MVLGGRIGRLGSRSRASVSVCHSCFVSGMYLLYSRRESVEGGVMSGCGLVQHTTREMKSGVKKDRERRGERKKGRQRQYDCVCVCMFMHICIREGGKNANGREGEGEVNWARRRRQRGRKKEKGRDSLRVHEQKK